MLEGEPAASAAAARPLPPAAATGARPPRVTWRHGAERYAELIAACQASIVAATPTSCA